MEIIETLKKGFRKKPNRWLIPLLGLGLFHSCVVEDAGSYQGKLSLELVSDTTLVQNQTRASSLLELNSFANTADYAVEILQGTTSVQKYDRYDKLPDEVSLKPGDYTIQVSKGKNEPAAYSSPYFTGKQDFTVVEGMTTPVTVTASMANSRVTVDLSDDFIETYPEYTLSFMTNKMKTPLEYEPGSPMYFQADVAGTKLTIAMELVNVYGKEVEYTATTTIKPKQWAALTVRTDEKGINGLAVDVTLNDGTNETIYVNIGIPDFMEKLKGAPFIACDFFGWEDTNVSTEQSTECDKDDKPAKVMITAGGKINQILLTLKDETATLINQYNLVNLTTEQKDNLANNYGFTAPEEIKDAIQAEFDLQPIVNALSGKLEDSYYELSLTVIDGLPKSNQTTKSVRIKVPAAKEGKISWGMFPAEGKEFEYGTFNPLLGIAPLIGIDVPAGIQEATISITGLDIEKQPINSLDLSNVEVQELTNNYIKLKFAVDWFNSLSYNENLTPKTYTVTFHVVDKLGREVSESRSFTVTCPIKWAMAEDGGDVFAKYAFLRVKADDANKLSFYHNGQQISSNNLKPLGKDESTGVVSFVWTGLNGNTSYTVLAKYDGHDIGETFFTTEEAKYLGDIGKLENWEAKGVNYDGEGYDINDNGWGTGRYPNPPYRSWEHWIVSGWATLNAKTTQYGGENSSSFTAFGNKNWTRYVANSGTIKTDGIDGGSAALIRTVGWGKNNTAPGEFIGISFDSKCENITAGELFLGSVTNYEPKYGIDFGSRPHGFKFKYKYIPKNPNDYFSTIIVVLDASGEEIARSYKTGTSSTDWTDFIVIVPEYKKKEVASMYVVFKSSDNPQCLTFNETNLSYPPKNNMSEGEYVGSQLYIDDVELIYDYE